MSQQQRDPGELITTIETTIYRVECSGCGEVNKYLREDNAVESAETHQMLCLDGDG